MLLLSREGAARVSRQLAEMEPTDRLFVVPGLEEMKTRAAITVIDPKL